MALQHSHMPTFTPDHFEYNTLPYLVIKNICETFLQTGFFHNFPEAFLWHYFDVNLDSAAPHFQHTFILSGTEKQYWEMGSKPV